MCVFLRKKKNRIEFHRPLLKEEEEEGQGKEEEEEWDAVGCFGMLWGGFFDSVRV